MAAGENDGLDDLGRRKRPRSNRVPEVIEGEAVALPPDHVVEPAPASAPELQAAGGGRRRVVCCARCCCAPYYPNGMEWNA